jgi:hypothetical protein
VREQGTQAEHVQEFEAVLGIGGVLGDRKHGPPAAEVVDGVFSSRERASGRSCSPAIAGLLWRYSIPSSDGGMAMVWQW